MPYLLVLHKVEDYDAWRRVFDEHAGARGAGGSSGGLLFRSPDDPNELALLLEWDDLARARQFADSDDLRRTMRKAGVSGQPYIFFLDRAEKIPV